MHTLLLGEAPHKTCCCLQTCVFDVTLSNQGAHVSALTIKVECSVEGGSTSVLYDNTPNPLQQLPFNAQEQLRVQTDIKEQGLITIVASAVFTGEYSTSCACAGRSHALWELWWQRKAEWVLILLVAIIWMHIPRMAAPALGLLSTNMT